MPAASHQGSSVYWAWACFALLASGLCTQVVADAGWALPVGYALGTLYPALLLVGALRYACRAAPHWLPVLALGVGAARGLAQLAGLPGLAHGVGLAVEPGLVLAAAGVAARAPVGSSSGLSQRLLAPALLGVAALEVASAVSMFGGEPLPEALVVAWVAGAPLLLAVQVGASSAAARRDLERGRELLEERVREQTERYRTVSQLSSDYSFSYLVGPHREVRCEWVTSALERITGFTQEELEGFGWLSLVGVEERESVFRQLGPVLRGERDAIDLRITTKAGEERHLRVHLTATGRAADGSLRVVGAGRDVTEQVRAGEERERMDRHVREVQRLESLGRLAGGIAHDFNNALTVILGNARLALDEAGGNRAAAARLQRIQSAAEFAAGLTEQILIYSGKAAVTLEPLDLSQVVLDTLELLHASLDGKASLETRLSGELPAVEGDVTQLRQVLVNFVTNASEALGEADGVIRVSTGLRSLAPNEVSESWGSPEAGAGDYVLLEVSDSGRGLDADARLRIFEPFFTTKETGRGLGLSAALGIVRAHRGLIRVDSEPGSGTVFQVLLPRSQARPPARTRAPEAPVRVEGRVLIIDDDQAVLEVAATFLGRCGFDVLTASACEAALDLLRDADVGVDAVVLDLLMPDLSTEQALRELRAARPGIPVVLTSGYDREQAARRFRQSGIAGFVRKPYGPEELVECVRATLAHPPEE